MGDVCDFVLVSDDVFAVEEGEWCEVCHKVETGHYIKFIETVMQSFLHFQDPWESGRGIKGRKHFSLMSWSNKSSILGKVINSW